MTPHANSRGLVVEQIPCTLWLAVPPTRAWLLLEVEMTLPSFGALAMQSLTSSYKVQLVGQHCGETSFTTLVIVCTYGSDEVSVSYRKELLLSIDCRSF